MEIDKRLLEAARRHQLIAPLLDPTLPAVEKSRIRLEILSEPVYHFEKGEVKLSKRTLRRWCKAYRERGIEGLLPHERKDAGLRKVLRSEVLDRALNILEEDPSRPLPMVIEMLEIELPEWKGRIKHATLWRNLRARGFVRVPATKHKGPFHRFEAKAPNELWQGDVLYGPVAFFAGNPRSTRFICWLDDYSRYIVHLEAYPDDQLPSLEDSLKKGALKHGLPMRIFCDNGLIYSCHAFSLTCSDLGIYKIHSTAGYPPSRGKIERVFRTLRSQFIRELEKVEPLPIEKVNQYLTAWVDKYNRHTHSETKQTPQERHRELGVPRMLPPEKLFEAFLQWDTRDISSTAEIKFRDRVRESHPS
jgi:transposase InsO family protein